MSDSIYSGSRGNRKVFEMFKQFHIAIEKGKSAEYHHRDYVMMNRKRYEDLKVIERELTRIYAISPPNAYENFAVYILETIKQNRLEAVRMLASRLKAWFTFKWNKNDTDIGVFIEAIDQELKRMEGECIT